ncbi:hypothetical protein FHS96_001138 [Sphingomonas zeicaulis]|uniref:hypothetical protein n=1 Tax=Sphingomonas zeicaulis TaxID=1632740 RepID=UPI003D21225E
MKPDDVIVDQTIQRHAGQVEFVFSVKKAVVPRNIEHRFQLVPLGRLDIGDQVEKSITLHAHHYAPALRHGRARTVLYSSPIDV